MSWPPARSAVRGVAFIVPSGPAVGALGPARSSLRGARRKSAVPAFAGGQEDSPGSGGSAGSREVPGEVELSRDGGHALDEDQPWTIQNFVSVLSGILGSLFSSFAFSRQREVSKGRLKNGAVAPMSSQKALSGGARIVQQLGGTLLDAEASAPLFSLGPVPHCTEASDLRRRGRHFTIITTAALPWLTGTAVNPLLRALALAKSGRPVVLVLPWLDKADQEFVFKCGRTFENAEEQELEIWKWCRERAFFKEVDKLPLQLRWYRAKYQASVRSIFPTGDCSMELGPGDPRDVLILEEPEHLCWYHHGTRWPTLFKHVIGIVHTNYQDYLSAYSPTGDFAGEYVPASLKEGWVFAASTLVCSAYCDVNIKLSATIMPLPNEVISNVHGVRAEFLAIGDKFTGDGKEAPVTAYYLGKALKEKGWGELLELLEAAGPLLKDLSVDGYGSGVNYEDIEKDAKELQHARLTIQPGRDHADEAIQAYSVLVNPSSTDVLCTVTVEALAMGKRCVLARHPSNAFFEENFPDRCYFFEVGDAVGFAQAVRKAIAAGPPCALPESKRHILTWEAAVERLFSAAEVRVLSGKYERPSDAAASRLAYRLHFDTMADKSIAANIIREATLGERTPWEEYFKAWRVTGMGKLKAKAKEGIGKFYPEHIQEHELYFKDQITELKSKLLPQKTGDSGGASTEEPPPRA